MFSKLNIEKIPVEETPHAIGSRKLLASKSDIPSKYFEAFTYGYLPRSEKWAMHKHEHIVEICLVIKGSGVIRDLNGNTESFKEGDRFVFPSNTEHELENTSVKTAEFYFFRLQE